MIVISEHNKESSLLTIGNDARKKLQAWLIIIIGKTLFPTLMTLAFKQESAVLGRFTCSFSTFHFFAYIIWNHLTWKQNKTSSCQSNLVFPSCQIFFLKRPFYEGFGSTRNGIKIHNFFACKNHIHYLVN